MLVIEEIIVRDIDKKLCGSGMHIGCACHGDGIFIILEAVGGLVLNRGANLFLIHARLESASLNHEAVNHAMKYGVVVKVRYSHSL